MGSRANHRIDPPRQSKSLVGSASFVQKATLILTCLAREGFMTLVAGRGTTMGEHPTYPRIMSQFRSHTDLAPEMTGRITVPRKTDVPLSSP